jgi:hypothetical protein
MTISIPDWVLLAGAAVIMAALCVAAWMRTGSLMRSKKDRNAARKRLRDLSGEASGK